LQAGTERAICGLDASAMFWLRTRLSKYNRNGGEGKKAGKRFIAEWRGDTEIAEKRKERGHDVSCPYKRQ
jgi:hypothetical protein